MTIREIYFFEHVREDCIRCQQCHLESRAGCLSCRGRIVFLRPHPFCPAKANRPYGQASVPHRAVKGYMWAVRNTLTGDVYFHYDMGSRSGETARRLIGGYRGAVQTDGYEVYSSFDGTPVKMMIGCWAHVRRKFVEALDENKKYASEAIAYISKLYKIEEEMRGAGLNADAVKERRQKESYPIIQDFEKWMDSVANNFSPKSRMVNALIYTYSLLPRLSRYVLDGRYSIDNNGIENAIRPLALGRKNYLLCGNHDAAVRAAVVYSLFSCCKAVGIDTRTWLEDVLKRIPSEPDLENLLPARWCQQ